MSIPGIDDAIVPIKSFDGTMIAAADFGPADRPAVILANGICCTDTYWTYFQPALAKAGYRVVFFDYRGHGRSGRPARESEMTLQSHARDLWTVADHFGIERAHLVGHSMGVQTIFAAYDQDRSRVTGLIPVAGPLEHPLDTLYMTPVGAVALAGLELAGRISAGSVRAAWKVGGLDPRLPVVVSKLVGAMGQAAPTELAEEYFEHLSSMDPMLIIKFYRHMQQYSARSVAAACGAPVLQVVGRKDTLTPMPVQVELDHLLPNSRMVVFPEASHTLPIDVPDEFASSVVDFLNETAGAGRP